MQDTTAECTCPDATAARDALRVGAFTTRDRTIQALVLLVVFVVIHLTSLQRSAQLDKAQKACVATLQLELPPLKAQITRLQASHLRTSKMHHAAVGVLDGVRYNQKPLERYAQRRTEYFLEE